MRNSLMVDSAKILEGNIQFLWQFELLRIYRLNTLSCLSISFHLTQNFEFMQLKSISKKLETNLNNYLPYQILSASLQLLS